MKGLALAALLACSWASSAWAGAPGSAGAEFLKLGQGARAIAMGESQAAVADDPYAAYWNPAGLASLLYPMVSVSYNRALEGVDQQYFSFAYPVKEGTTLDLNLTRMGMSSFQGYDALGVKTRAVSASDYAFGVAAAHTMLRDDQDRPLLNGGINLKGIRSQLDKASASTYAADVGALLYLFRGEKRFSPGHDPGLRLAFTARNLGPGLRFDADTAPLPTILTGGVAWRGYPRGDSFTVSADAVRPKDSEAYGAFGVEYTAFRILSMRLGFRTGQDIGLGFRAGVGFRLKVVEVDYAFAGFGDLGQMHRIGLSARLGGPVEATPPEERKASEALQRGKRYLDQGRDYEAVLEFDEVLRLDPGNREALELMRRAHERLKK